MDRRHLLKALASTGVALSAGCGKTGSAAGGKPSDAKVLRIIHTVNLASLDPIWSSAPGAKDYGYMTFDQLLAVDANYKPQPQMAEGWSEEDDGRTYAFTLREGLKFHDGQPVRSQDCIPSIRRWGARDGFGQLMMKVVDDFQVVDDRRFKIKLKRAFPLLPAAIGKSASSQCFIMPERMAMTPPNEQVTESIGSGPYRFLKDEWVSGAHAAWAKFDGYIPRKEPVSGIAGGRIPAVDRVEWSVITDASTAMAALVAGEQDYWDIPPPDLIAPLRASPGVKVGARNSSGVYYMMQFNHLQPPFNNPGVRKAVAMAVDQAEFLKASSSDPALIKPCYSVYACDTPYASETGAEVIRTRSLDAAKAQLQKAGYAGEKVVLLGTTEGALGAMGQVADDLLRRLGMNVELVVVDNATMAQRRVNKEPVDKGGWSIFLTGWTGADILNPAVNQMLRGAGQKSYPGWPDDPKLEALRDAWAVAVDPAERAKLATAIQVQAFENLPYVPLGASVLQSAYRDNLTGIFPAPVAAYWNIGKSV
jgi:peptide/nickel transport system substrate-binding protein